jgi:uncharacterized protein (TIGR03067 family)
MNHFPVLTLLLLTSCAGKSSQPDTKLIVGEWVVVDFQTPKAEEDRSQRRKKASISAGTWSQQFQGEQFVDFEYTLDPSKSPKQIDLTSTAPDGKRLTVRGIYEFTDPDRMRVCLGTSPLVEKKGKPDYVESVRPVAFEAKDGPLITYRRATK